MSLSLAFVIITQFLIGLGVVTRLRAVTNGYSLLGLAMLVGLGVSSALPFGLAFAHLPIAPTPMLIGLGVWAALSLILLRNQSTYLRKVFAPNRLSVRLCELPFVAFWGYLLFISAWKCAWFPVTPFDMQVGPDLVATFAVREQTLASSVFTEHLPSVSVLSNQPFYAPFTAMQQVIYLLAVDSTGPFAFGKVWLTVLVVAFGLFFYAELRERIHPLLAGLLLTLLACTPELFAYTFLVQTDWANAAFLASGVLLFQRYLDSAQRGSLMGSVLMLALACWTRTETIFFVLPGALLVFINRIRSSPAVGLIQSAGLFLACLVPVLFWNYGFLRGCVPLPPQIHLGQLHDVAGNHLQHLVAIFAGMNKQVVFNANHWSYAVPIFLLLTTLNLVVFRDKNGLPVLIWLLSIYLLFGLLIQYVDGANIPYTFRRGFFKLLFLMYIYLSNTTLFDWLSVRLYQWEGRPAASLSTPQP
ncbi:glycosyltransferase family 39 protein [Spirosoma soli]|uniref:Glycosyltransferase family 39 protein n=1 Tax=Spirosoma soli TaxID=1770529 RepID=A0ABW5M6U4_9BACT